VGDLLTDDDSFSGWCETLPGSVARVAGERYLGMPIDRERYVSP